MRDLCDLFDISDDSGAISRNVQSLLTQVIDVSLIVSDFLNETVLLILELLYLSGSFTVCKHSLSVWLKSEWIIYPSDIVSFEHHDATTIAD